MLQTPHTEVKVYEKQLQVEKCPADVQTVSRLSGCLVTDVGCKHLAVALESNPSHLMKLDLSYNNLGASGEKLLSDLREDPRYGLSKLKYSHYCCSSVDVGHSEESRVTDPDKH